MISDTGFLTQCYNPTQSTCSSSDVLLLGTSTKSAAVTFYPSWVILTATAQQNHRQWIVSFTIDENLLGQVQTARESKWAYEVPVMSWVATQVVRIAGGGKDRHGAQVEDRSRGHGQAQLQV
jgi:hypothetical protein